MLEVVHLSFLCLMFVIFPFRNTVAAFLITSPSLLIMYPEKLGISPDEIKERVTRYADFLNIKKL